MTASSRTTRWSNAADLASTAIGSFFGYDFFISYAWADGRAYAVNLLERLSKDGRSFRCFLNSKEMAGGAAWREAVRRALRRSSVLVIVGSETALTRDAVYDEVLAFASLGRPIVPIDFDFHIACLAPEHRLHRLIAGRLRTVEPQGAAALNAGQAHDEVIAYLNQSFKFVRVGRVRQLVLTIVIAVLAGLLVVAVDRFLAERASRQLAEARQRDAIVSSVRFATLNGDFENAGEMLRAAPTSDDRVEWARWVVGQHEAPTSRLISAIAGAQMLDGLSSLAVGPSAKFVAALARSTRQVDTPACRQAQAKVLPDPPAVTACRIVETMLVALDLEAGAVKAKQIVDDGANSVAAATSPDEFYVTANGAIKRFALKNSGWQALALSLGRRYQQIVLFDGASAGAAIAEGTLWKLRLDGSSVIKSKIMRLEAGQKLVRTLDGRSAAVTAVNGAQDASDQPDKAPPLALAVYVHKGDIVTRPLPSTGPRGPIAEPAVASSDGQGRPSQSTASSGRCARPVPAKSILSRGSARCLTKRGS